MQSFLHVLAETGYCCGACRPHPNECSGSDLDGDLYFVSWDKDLIPPTTDEPMDYTSPGAMNLDHPVTIEASHLLLYFHYVQNCYN